MEFRSLGYQVEKDFVLLRLSGTALRLRALMKVRSLLVRQDEMGSFAMCTEDVL